MPRNYTILFYTILYYYRIKFSKNENGTFLIRVLPDHESSKAEECQCFLWQIFKLFPDFQTGHDTLLQ